MRTAMGLFERREDAERARLRLEQAGFAARGTRMLDTPQAVWQHMDCSHRPAVFKVAAIGAAIGLLIYGVFGVGDACCAVDFGLPIGLAIGSAIVFVALGTGMGAFIGSLIGRAEAEKDTHLYLEGVRRGAILMLVQSDEERVSAAMDILRRQNAIGVRICDRARELPQATGSGHPRPL